MEDVRWAVCVPARIPLELEVVRALARRLGRRTGRGWLRRARRGAAVIKRRATVSLYEFEPPDRGLRPPRIDPSIRRSF